MTLSIQWKWRSYNRDCALEETSIVRLGLSYCIFLSPWRSPPPHQHSFLNIPHPLSLPFLSNSPSFSFSIEEDGKFTIKADLFPSSSRSWVGENEIPLNEGELFIYSLPMMPRYDMDTTRIRHRYDRDTDFICKKWSIRYETTRYGAYFEVSVHYSSLRRSMLGFVTIKNMCASSYVIYLFIYLSVTVTYIERE